MDTLKNSVASSSDNFIPRKTLVDNKAEILDPIIIFYFDVIEVSFRKVW